MIWVTHRCVASDSNMLRGQTAYFQFAPRARQIQSGARERDIADRRAHMAGMYGRLPPCSGINGVNFNHAGLDFYSPDSQMYGECVSTGTAWSRILGSWLLVWFLILILLTLTSFVLKILLLIACHSKLRQNVPFELRVGRIYHVPFTGVLSSNKSRQNATG